MKKLCMLFLTLFTVQVTQAHVVVNYNQTMADLVAPESEHGEYYLNYNNSSFVADDNTDLMSASLEAHKSKALGMYEDLYFTDLRVKTDYVSMNDVMNHLFVEGHKPYFCYTLVDILDEDSENVEHCKRLTKELLAPIFNQNGINYAATMVYTAGNMYGDYRSLSLFFPTSESTTNNEDKSVYGQLVFDILHEI